NSAEHLYEADIYKIYPNPARDWIVVEGRNIRSIEAIDLCGRIVLPKMTASSFKTVVDISSLIHGLYFIRINTPEQSFVQKFIHNKN
ncbi:MAG: T9SS type A sorting domain-containing protein, partial [Chitinophagaceae bacterium]